VQNAGRTASGCRRTSRSQLRERDGLKIRIITYARRSQMIDLYAGIDPIVPMQQGSLCVNEDPGKHGRYWVVRDRSILGLQSHP
jgi:hypothetical protein